MVHNNDTVHDATIVFADLTGSTRVFETIGNARAAETVTRLIQWISRVCESHRGRVVKSLGDGVFAIFPDGATAIEAVVELQRHHRKRLANWPQPLHMALKIGVATGPVVEVKGDAYGDAVNLASRLSDLAGPEQVWVTDSVVAHLRDGRVRHRSLGPITIRGRQERPLVHCIDWQEETTDFLTLPAPLARVPSAPNATFGQIELSWLDVRSTYRAAQMPIHLGRVEGVHFIVNDPRVSRRHARLEARQGNCILVDTSTYGTWVRFHGSDGTSNEIVLRRGECMLHGSGEIGLGAPLSDFTSPTVSFSTTGGSAPPSQRSAR